MTTAGIKYLLSPISTYLTSIEFREFIRLLHKYNKTPRYTSETVAFLGYKMKVVDYNFFR